MKKTLLLITSLVFLTTIAFSQSKVNIKSLVLYGDKMYKSWKWWSEDGKMDSSGTYKDGKLNGLSIEWHENGQKKKEGTYKDGEKDVLWTFWNENGHKIREGTAKDGKPYGKWTYFNEDGSVKEVKEF